MTSIVVKGVKKMWKRWFQSKVVWLGILTFIISLLSFLQGEELIKQYPEVISILGIIIGVLTIIVRYMTDQPMELTRKWQNEKRKRSGYNQQ